MMWKNWKTTPWSGVEVQRRRAEVVRRPVGDRVDRRAVRSSDVDALVEREEAGAVERVGEDPVLVDRARVAEDATDRVLLVERLERPRVRRGRALMNEKQARALREAGDETFAETGVCPRFARFRWAPWPCWPCAVRFAPMSAAENHRVPCTVPSKTSADQSEGDQRPNSPRACSRASATRRSSARPAPARRRRWRGRSRRSAGRRSIIAHNKTLAAQLCNEFREFFPHNAVEYFVSYYDYYQPEAYVPQADLYIEKDSSRNDDIDRLRHSATSSSPVAPRRDHRRVGLVHLRPRLAGGVQGARRLRHRRRGAGPRPDAAQADRHPVRPQRHAARPRPLPREGRRRRGAAGVLGDGIPHLVLRRRGRGDHALRPAHRARCSRSTTRSRSSRRRST